MSKFKFRHARLISILVGLIAIVVDGGAGYKFYAGTWRAPVARLERSPPSRGSNAKAAVTTSPSLLHWGRAARRGTSVRAPGRGSRRARGLCHGQVPGPSPRACSSASSSRSRFPAVRGTVK
jgi:hypothetical protein